MNYTDMKNKVLALIEEINPNSTNLTDDPDIAAKFDEVTNQIMFELARMKKIPKFVQMAVTEGDLVSFEDISNECAREIYQVTVFGGVAYEPKANGTMFKVLENGTADIDCFIYPQRITDANKAEYEFDLSPDALEIMPYGIAGDLLKSDVSAEYGNVYSVRYESMLQRLDPRYHLPSITIEGGVTI